MSTGLQIFLARDPLNRLEPRLIVARRIEQVIPMVKVGMMVERCSPFQAFRYGRLGLNLEYAVRSYQTESA